MLRSLFLLSTLVSLLLIGAANVGAQQTKPGTHRAALIKKKPAPGTPVSGTAKRSSATTRASGASRTTAAAASTPTAATSNDPNTPNTVNTNGSIGSQESADGKGQGAYAAPGMMVKPRDKHVGSYDGKAAGARRTTKGGSTMTPAGSKP